MYNVFGQGGPHLYGERIIQTANTMSFIKRSLPHSPIYVIVHVSVTKLHVHCYCKHSVLCIVRVRAQITLSFRDIYEELTDLSNNFIR